MNTLNILPVCPSCNGKTYAQSYYFSLKILKDQIWQICKEYGFEQLAEDFKKEKCFRNASDHICSKQIAEDYESTNRT